MVLFLCTLFHSLNLFSRTNLRCLIPLIIVRSLTGGVSSLVLVGWFWTGSSLTSLNTLSASRLALFYLMPKGCHMVCPRALSCDQSYFHYILLPSAKLFKIIPGISFHFYYVIMYLYSAQYLHILQDSKRYLTNPTVYSR